MVNVCVKSHRDVEIKQVTVRSCTSKALLLRAFSYLGVY